MKNVQLNINPYAINNFASPPLPSGLIPTNQTTTSVALNVQFDNENEALAFAKFMIENIQNYKVGGV